MDAGNARRPCGTIPLLDVALLDYLDSILLTLSSSYLHLFRQALCYRLSCWATISAPRAILYGDYIYAQRPVRRPKPEHPVYPSLLDRSQHDRISGSSHAQSSEERWHLSMRKPTRRCSHGLRGHSSTTNRSCYAANFNSHDSITTKPVPLVPPHIMPGSRIGWHPLLAMIF